ncbi:hypothetical protein H4Q26_002332 [Puccinia striiformis f. sp. tritici PST-130]|nr:hypothetical protein H4Q26_002332 [Puccinia striiformis f. sp. tritici PST-130]
MSDSSELTAGLLTSSTPFEVCSAAHIYPQVTKPLSGHYSRLIPMFAERGLYAKDPRDVERLNEFFGRSKFGELVTCEALPVPGGDKLQLKVGMPIRLTKDIEQDGGLPKGSRLVITFIMENFIEAESISTNQYRSLFSIPRSVLHCRNPDLPMHSFVRYQYPIEPCYASPLKWVSSENLKYRCVFKCSF